MIGNTKIWAHRGASGYAPENTLEAFELASQQGADGLELDVHISRDGHLIVMHDERVDRTTDGIGQIQNMTLKELKKLNAGTKEQSMEIPTLEEVYSWARHNALEINVEIKSDSIAYDNIESLCLEAAARYGVESRIWYSSFNHDSLYTIKRLNSAARTGILYGQRLFRPWEYAKILGADAIHPHFASVAAGDCVSECRGAGICVHPWTVNDEADILQMLAQGVEAVITNYPAKAIQIREARQG